VGKEQGSGAKRAAKRPDGLCVFCGSVPLDCLALGNIFGSVTHRQHLPALYFSVVQRSDGKVCRHVLHKLTESIALYLEIVWGLSCVPLVLIAVRVHKLIKVHTVKQMQKPEARV